MMAGRRSTVLILTASLAVAASCSEKTEPTALGPRDAALAPSGGNAAKVKIKTFQLSSNTLYNDGPAVTGTVHVGNSGGGLDDVRLRAEITQGAATREAASFDAGCPGPSGFLPSGGCDMTFSAAASTPTQPHRVWRPMSCGSRRALRGQGRISAHRSSDDSQSARFRDRPHLRYGSAPVMPASTP
jgi:hypothetical protein